MFDEIIDKNKNNIINTVCDLIKFQSVSIETENPEMPFGEQCKKALDYFLNLGNSMGFRTKNVDNYCGYIEFGSGEELVGIIGHLDVVPALEEDGWTTPPFEPSIRDGKLFGRGSIDDKGPVVAALYAMKAVAEKFKVNKRIRLIVGLNEEKDWKCINYYKKCEEHPIIGFSPDANFPAIYAEKGIISVELKNKFLIKNMTILNIDCNNNALNVVPKYCSITLKYNSDSDHYTFNNINNSESNTKIEVQNVDENTIKIISYGIASHAAHPELGVNAITNLVKYLIENTKISFDNENNEYTYLNTLYNLGLFETESPFLLSENNIENIRNNSNTQKNIIQDETGILTSNVAVLDYQNENLIIKINLRVPIKTTLEYIEKQYRKLSNNFKNIEINVLGKQNGIYVPKDSYLVKTLVDIFNKKTGISKEAIAIGGGTYARAFENCISYGMTMPGDLDMCHQVDEFVEIDKLILSSKIYAEAIYELSKEQKKYI